MWYSMLKPGLRGKYLKLSTAEKVTRFKQGTCCISGIMQESIPNVVEVTDVYIDEG